MLSDKAKAYVQQCYRFIETNQLQERVRNDGLTFICDDHVIRVSVDRRGRYVFDVQPNCIVLSVSETASCEASCPAGEELWEQVDFVSVWEQGSEIVELRSRARLNCKTQEVELLENEAIHQEARETLARQYIVLAAGEEREVSRGIGRDQRVRLYAFKSAI